jgi:transposase InsO family protein
MGALSAAARSEIRDRMAGLSGAEARSVAGELASGYEITEATVYRLSQDVRRTRKRSTAGKRRLPVDERILQEMAKCSVDGDMTATDIVEHFELNGWIEPGLVSPSYLTRYLKEHGLSRREMRVDRRPYRRFEASEPNQVFQIDATLAEQFYLDDDGSIDWEGRASCNKNRAGNRKTRLYIIGIIDDHSRCVYAEFVTSVTTNDWLRFEFNAFRRKADPRFIFHGLPRILYMDNDSVAKNEKFLRAHEILGIKIIKHKPTKKTDTFSNARSKGKIERFFLYLAQKQRVTKFGKFQSLEEANRWLLDVCHRKNGTRHSSTGEIPYQRWMRISDERLIRCEDSELYNALYRDRTERQVYGDRTIRMDGTVYQLPGDEIFYRMIKQKVMVFMHPQQPESMCIGFEGKEYEVPLIASGNGNWSAGPVRHPQTAIERKQAELRQIETRPMKTYGEFEEQPEERAVAFMPFTRGTDLDTSALVPEPKRMERIDAMLRIADRLRVDRLDTATVELLTDMLDDWVTDEELEAAIEQLTSAGQVSRAG